MIWPESPVSSARMTLPISAVAPSGASSYGVEASGSTGLPNDDVFGNAFVASSRRRTSSTIRRRSASVSPPSRW